MMLDRPLFRCRARDYFDVSSDLGAAVLRRLRRRRRFDFGGGAVDELALSALVLVLTSVSLVEVCVLVSS